MITYPHIMLVAGEASGDKHAADLMIAIQKKKPDSYFSGIGGLHMKKAGLHVLFSNEKMAVVGVSEILTKLLVVYKAWKVITKAMQVNRPDLLILVDYGGFNLKLAAFAHKLGIKILYYISPQIWASRYSRIYKIKKYVDHIAVILPFEAPLYRQENIPVTYVGLPLVDQIQSIGIKQARKQLFDTLGLDVDENTLFITLAPGSRNNEIKKLLPLLVATAEKLFHRHPQCKFLIPIDSNVKQAQLAVYFQNTVVQPLFVHNSYLAIEASHLVIGASGTLTLECALLRTPIIVIYKVATLSYYLIKHFITVPYIALCNIVAETKLVPELLQKQANSKNIYQAVQSLLDNPEKYQAIVAGMNKVKKKLGVGGAAAKTAKIALKLIE